MDSQTLVANMREFGIWPEQETVQAEIERLQQAAPDGRSLSRELLKRSLLTPYQANQILTGHGKSLVIGPYRILQRLGEGGAAQVFKARHGNTHRIVALKLIRRERVTDDTAVQRFLREAEAAAQLSHPNVVRAYDADVAGEGYYFAMEFLDGIDLAKLVVRDGPLEIDRACEYVRQAALGLQHIHEHGMIHRDVKPSNLMVTRMPGWEASLSIVSQSPGASRLPQAVAPYGQVKVLDLGIARLVENPEMSNQQAALTKLGTIVGTPDFISPEQAMNSRHVDIRSDIYSLGCTLYFLLAGRPPFLGESAIEVMLRHQMDEPPPIEDIRPNVPPPVKASLKRMTAKKPDDRYQTPSEAAAALDYFLNEKPVAAVPVNLSAPAPPAAGGARVSDAGQAGGVGRPAPILEGEEESPEWSFSEPAVPSTSLDYFADLEGEADKVVPTSRVERLRPQLTEWSLWILLIGVVVVVAAFLAGAAIVTLLERI